MIRLIKNLFFSSLFCFILQIIIQMVGNYIIQNTPSPQAGSLGFILPSYAYLFFEFTLWPIIQTIIFIRLYGFKSIQVTLVTYVLLFISMPAAWYLFFGIVKFFTGRASTSITIVSNLGLYAAVLFVQVILFFTFIYKPVVQDY